MMAATRFSLSGSSRRVPDPRAGGERLEVAGAGPPVKLPVGDAAELAQVKRGRQPGRFWHWVWPEVQPVGGKCPLHLGDGPPPDRGETQQVTGAQLQKLADRVYPRAVEVLAGADLDVGPALRPQGGNRLVEAEFGAFLGGGDHGLFTR